MEKRKHSLLHALIWPPAIIPDYEKWKRLPFEVQARWAKLVNARVEAELDESRGIDVSEEFVNLNKLWWKESRCHNEMLAEATGVEHSEGLQEDGGGSCATARAERSIRRTREGSPASEDSQESPAQKCTNARHVIREYHQGRRWKARGKRGRKKH